MNLFKWIVQSIHWEEKLKIARFISSLNLHRVTGPQNQIIRISKGLFENSKIVSHIFSSNTSQKKMSKFLINQTKCLVAPTRFNFWGFNFPFFPNNLILDKYDILHAHGIRSGEIIYAYQMSKKQGVPFVLSPHGELYSYSYFLPKIYRFPYLLFDNLIGRKMLSHADAIICASKQEMKEGKFLKIDEEKLFLIAPPREEKIISKLNFNLDRDFKPEQFKMNKHEDFTIKLLTVARFSRDRRFDRILSVAKLLYKKKIPFRWDIVGDEAYRSKSYHPNFKKLMKSSKKLKLPIVFHGELHGDDLKKIYTLSDIFVYLSDYENYGQSLAEAAIAGLKIISTPVGAAIDLAKYAVVKFVKNDNYQVVSKIIKTQQELKSNFGTSNLEDNLRKLINNLSISSICEQYEKVYNMLVS